MNKNFIISGTGGQGVLSIGAILANIFMLSDLFVTYTSCYGAEMRGGAVNCQIAMSDEELYLIQSDEVDVAVVLNQASYDKFISKIKENGTIIVNSSLTAIKKTRQDINYIFAPLTQIAIELGNIKMANSIALGILSKTIGLFPIDIVKRAYEKILKNKYELIEKNISAYLEGCKYIQEGTI